MLINMWDNVQVCQFMKLKVKNNFNILENPAKQYQMFRKYTFILMMDLKTSYQLYLENIGGI